MLTAPLYNDAAGAPPGGKARWVTTSDNIRLRFAWWDVGEKGTVLIFPGRTEFVEKYGRTVRDFLDADYASVVIDWRGQGLSDRLTPNRLLGHVGQFSDYQLDIAAVLNALAGLDLPQPFYLCAHSMGGAIALRALQGGLPVKRSVFTAPMWGMMIDPILRPLASAVARGTLFLGLGEEFAPGTGGQNYIESHKFEGNPLTSDPEMFAYMSGLMTTYPGLSIGGPSVHWFHEALAECNQLMKSTPPDHDALCFLGSEETVIDKRDVARFMDKWPRGRVEINHGAKHEVMMETPAIRANFMAETAAFFNA